MAHFKHGPTFMNSTLAWWCLLGGVAYCGSVAAVEIRGDIPANSHYTSGEQGWACDNGFRQAAQLCVLDNHRAPGRGSFEYFDGQWRCRSGYQRGEHGCVPLTAPANATLVGGGQRWECDWGYQRVGSHCEEITPPAHGYLDAAGHDWQCYPGFQRAGDRCIQQPGPPPTATEPPARTVEATPAATPTGDTTVPAAHAGSPTDPPR